MALCSLQATQALISLCIHAGWTGPVLSAYIISWYYSICQRTKNVQIRLLMSNYATLSSYLTCNTNSTTKNCSVVPGVSSHWVSLLGPLQFVNTFLCIQWFCKRTVEYLIRLFGCTDWSRFAVCICFQETFPLGVSHIQSNLNNLNLYGTLFGTSLSPLWNLFGTSLSPYEIPVIAQENK